MPDYPVHPRVRVPAGEPVQVRNADPEVWQEDNPVLKKGEPGWDGTDFKIGDGVTRWNDLPAANAGSGSGGGLTEQDVADALADESSPIRTVLDTIISGGGGGEAQQRFFRAVTAPPAPDATDELDLGGGLVVNTGNDLLVAYRVGVAPPTDTLADGNLIDIDPSTWQIIDLNSGGTSHTGDHVAVNESSVTLDEGAVVYRQLLPLADVDLLTAGVAVEWDDDTTSTSYLEDVSYGLSAELVGNLANLGIDGGRAFYIFDLGIPDGAAPRMFNYDYSAQGNDPFFLPAITRDEILVALQDMIDQLAGAEVTIDLDNAVVCLSMRAHGSNYTYLSPYYFNGPVDGWSKSLTKVGALTSAHAQNVLTFATQRYEYLDVTFDRNTTNGLMPNEASSHGSLGTIGALVANSNVAMKWNGIGVLELGVTFNPAFGGAEAGQTISVVAQNDAQDVATINYTITQDDIDSGVSVDLGTRAVTRFWTGDPFTVVMSGDAAVGMQLTAQVKVHPWAFSVNYDDETINT